MHESRAKQDRIYRIIHKESGERDKTKETTHSNHSRNGGFANSGVWFYLPAVFNL
jgi:hypothetical protein